MSRFSRFLSHLESRVPDLVALVLLVVVGHLEAGGDELLHLVLLQAEHGTHGADVLALIYKKKNGSDDHISRIR